MTTAEQVVKLQLFPDPEDRTVWENMRRIAAWADALAAQQQRWADLFFALGT